MARKTQKQEVPAIQAAGFLQTFATTAADNGWAVTLLDEGGVEYLGLTHLWPSRTIPEGGAIAVKADAYVAVTAFSTANSVMPRLDCAIADGKRIGTVYQTLRTLKGEDASKDAAFKRAKKEADDRLTVDQMDAMTAAELRAYCGERDIAVSKRASKGKLIEAVLAAA